jgi:hypothetical protein
MIDEIVDVIIVADDTDVVGCFDLDDDVGGGGGGCAIITSILQAVPLTHLIPITGGMKSR